MKKLKKKFKKLEDMTGRKKNIRELKKKESKKEEVIKGEEVITNRNK
jgi:hypothetical protein